SLMAVNIHITIIELNALHTKRQNLFQELDAVIHLLMEAKHWGLRKSRNATSLNSRFKSLDTLKVKIISVRSEERFSRNAETDLVCRLLLEKKKRIIHGGSRQRQEPHSDHVRPPAAGKQLPALDPSRGRLTGHALFHAPPL